MQEVRKGSTLGQGSRAQRRWAMLAAALAVRPARAASAGIVTIAPGSAAGAIGDAQGPAPLRFYGTGGARTQELYDHSFFSAPESITDIVFRPTSFPAGLFFGNTVTVSDLQITLSTSL